MFKKKGLLICIEGSSDAVGKNTQSELLMKKLKGLSNRNTHKISFPQYESISGQVVKHYLEGKNTHNEWIMENPYAASTLFATDRLLAAANGLGDILNDRDSICIADRYVPSNMFYQAARIDLDFAIQNTGLRKEDFDMSRPEDVSRANTITKQAQDRFVSWINEFEYNQLRLPRPDIVIFLNADFELSQDLLEKRSAIRTKDIHEKDVDFLRHVCSASLSIAENLGYSIIQCTESGEMKSIEEIHELICEEIKNKFPSLSSAF